MSAGFRKLRIDVEALLDLLKAMCGDKEIRISSRGLPTGTALASLEVDLEDDGTALVLQLVHHQWPDHPDSDTPIELTYQRRDGKAGVASDWSADISIAGAQRA